MIILIFSLIIAIIVIEIYIVNIITLFFYPLC